MFRQAKGDIRMEKRKHFDKEYSTTFLREVEYLNENNIQPSFVKKIDDTIIYKYEKSKELFLVLSNYYSLK